MHDDAKNESGPNLDRDESAIPALALGALDSTEEDAATDALRTSDDARAELRAMNELIGDLGLAVEQADPPADLRARILQATASANEPIALETARERRSSWLAWAGSAAAALLILILGLTAFSQWSTAQDRGDQIGELESELASQEVLIAQLEQAASGAGAFVNFEQPLIWTELAATSENGDSPGFLARTADGQTAYLVLNGVEVDAEHVFQAWLIEDSPVPAGTLRPSENGMGFLILDHPDVPVQNFSLIGVTIEPPGGSPQPTSDPIIVGEIA
jgi:anti-sigma-K factor RskA